MSCTMPAKNTVPSSLIKISLTVSSRSPPNEFNHKQFKSESRVAMKTSDDPVPPFLLSTDNSSHVIELPEK